MCIDSLQRRCLRTLHSGKVGPDTDLSRLSEISYLRKFPGVVHIVHSCSGCCQSCTSSDFVPSRHRLPSQPRKPLALLRGLPLSRLAIQLDCTQYSAKARSSTSYSDGSFRHISHCFVRFSISSITARDNPASRTPPPSITITGRLG